VHSAAVDGNSFASLPPIFCSKGGCACAASDEKSLMSLLSLPDNKLLEGWQEQWEADASAKHIRLILLRLRHGGPKFK
jgi:hypothetical protein